ncbi:hypothetical protein chiPu_0004049 [Chiloscyllium punctatum]|uniref:Uncharacterized protein n=1 Tax=Chiloscyllium punctatum TaxID=137246 RepID=A0A401S5I0_CHIPU|nr:hypothetical protein [Chiloscyllium punctatum]
MSRGSAFSPHPRPGSVTKCRPVTAATGEQYRQVARTNWDRTLAEATRRTWFIAIAGLRTKKLRLVQVLERDADRDRDREKERGRNGQDHPAMGRYVYAISSRQQLEMHTPQLLETRKGTRAAKQRFFGIVDRPLQGLAGVSEVFLEHKHQEHRLALHQHILRHEKNKSALKSSLKTAIFFPLVRQHCEYLKM